MVLLNADVILDFGFCVRGRVPLGILLFFFIFQSLKLYDIIARGKQKVTPKIWQKATVLFNLRLLRAITKNICCWAESLLIIIINPCIELTQ